MMRKKNKPRNILFLCQYFYPETLSSAVLPYELATEFFEHGYTVSALVGYPNEYLKSNYNVPLKQNVHGINVERLKYTGVDRHSKLGRVANILSFSMAVMAHPQKIKKADVLICTTNPPLLPYVASIYAKRYHKKLVVIVYDVYPDAPIRLGYLGKDSKIAVAFNKLYESVFRYCFRIVVLSTEMKDYMIHYKKIKEDKVSVIPNWYRDVHKNVEYMPKLPITIFYGGNMGEAQEMDTLIEAIKALKDDDRFNFIFVGQGSQKEKIEKIVKDERLRNCKVYDFLEKQIYDQLIENATLTVLSLKQEICGLGSPSKFYGYLAAKKPVIAIVPEDTDVARDIEEYRAGAYIPFGESDKLVEFLINCAERLEDLKSMSENAYKLFLDKYTLAKSFAKYEEIVRG